MHMYFHVHAQTHVASDLARMYMLVSRLSEDHGRDELQTRFEAHVHSQGVAAVEKCGESAQNVRHFPHFFINLEEVDRERGGKKEGKKEGGMVEIEWRSF